MINNIVRLLFVLTSFPLFQTLDTSHTKNFSAATPIASKKLIDAYALYVAITKEYKDQWIAIEKAHADQKKLHGIIHTMILTAQDQPNGKATLFQYKENQPYQELPYLYFKKNLDTTKKKIVWYLTRLHTQHTIEQAAIASCLNHTLKKIEFIENVIVTTPQYYKEQLKTASVKQQPALFPLLQASIGFVVKKFIPLF